MRKLGLALLLVLLGGGLGWGWRWYAERGLPRYDGRSVRSWFEQTCRLAASSDGIAQEARVLECRMAILSMGTNAVPFLVEQAMSGRRDGKIRSALRWATKKLPGRRRSGWLVPFAEVQAQAQGLLRPLRPSADQILPWAVPRVSSANDAQRHMALALLGCIGDGAERGVPFLVDALDRKEDPWVRAVAGLSLRWLGSRAAGALDAVIGILDPAAVDRNLMRWLAELGPAASNAVPTLEGLLAAEDPGARMAVVVALLNIQADHEAALGMLRRTVADGVAAGSAARAVQETLEFEWSLAPRRSHPKVGEALEPLARAEMRAWRVNQASYRAARAVERVAPERMAPLYREALNGTAWLHAATGLLRLDRNDPVATGRLVAAVRADSEESLPALMALREAGASNAEAMRALEDSANRLSAAGEPLDAQGFRRQVIARNAAYLLTRIRFRAWMERAGIDENEW